MALRTVTAVEEDYSLRSPAFRRWLFGRGTVYVSQSAAEFVDDFIDGDCKEMLPILEIYPEKPPGKSQRIETSEFPRYMESNVRHLVMRPEMEVGIIERKDSSLVVYPHIRALRRLFSIPSDPNARELQNLMKGAEEVHAA